MGRRPPGSCLTTKLLTWLDASAVELGIHRTKIKSTPACRRPVHLGVRVDPNLAFTRYCFTYSRFCINQSSFHSSRPPALPTLVQYHCTSIGQYTTPLPQPLVFYAIHHIVLVITISCKGQPLTRWHYACTPFFFCFCSTVEGAHLPRRLSR